MVSRQSLRRSNVTIDPRDRVRSRDALAESEKVGRHARLTGRHRLIEPHTHLGSDIASSANTGCPPPTTASKVVAIASLDM